MAVLKVKVLTAVVTAKLIMVSTNYFNSAQTLAPSLNCGCRAPLSSVGFCSSEEFEEFLSQKNSKTVLLLSVRGCK